MQYANMMLVFLTQRHDFELQRAFSTASGFEFLFQC